MGKCSYKQRNHDEISRYDEPIFTGKFIIEKKNLKSEYDVVGIACNL